jgi:hypothetical protein
LSVFLGDGRVPIDNNETEQLMKQVATGRKNWLFIGSVEAGYRAAILMIDRATLVVFRSGPAPAGRRAEIFGKCREARHRVTWRVACGNNALERRSHIFT